LIFSNHLHSQTTPCELKPDVNRIARIAIAPTTLEPPPDLFHADGTAVAPGELPFSTVAYGLSNIDFLVPEAFTPDEVAPMPERNERRERLDRDDLYAK